MITALEKVLNTEETQPALDALAANVATRTEFLKIFSKFYSEQKEKAITDLSGRAMEEAKFAAEKAAWASKDETEKRDYLIDKTRGLLTMTPEERNLFADTMSKS